MSVYIKGMEMPESCDECVFMETQDSGFGNDYICGISKQDVDGVCDCPLIEVPPHGRLIDADAINHEDEIWKKKCIPPQVVYNAWVVAGEMPTIIEAEEET